MEAINFRILMSICNVITLVFIARGIVAIRKDQKDTHKKSMILAIIASAILVVFYLLDAYYHGPMKHENPQGLFKFVLVSHIILATINPFTVIATAILAMKGKFEAHKKLVRISLPLWIYVSITGIWIYLT